MCVSANARCEIIAHVLCVQGPFLRPVTAAPSARKKWEPEAAPLPFRISNKPSETQPQLLP